MGKDSPSRPRVFLDLNHGTQPFGRLVIELFPDQAPPACENFLALCTPSPTNSTSSPPRSYKLTPFHRLIPTFILQGGDILNRDGTGRYSIFPPSYSTFPDSPSSYQPINAAGLVCLANGGQGTGSNSSQFYISLAPSPETTASVFGRVVNGLDLLTQIDDLPVDSSDRPVTDLVIASCGSLTPSSRSTKTQPRVPAESPSRGRGRVRSDSFTSQRSGREQGQLLGDKNEQKHNGHRQPSLDPTQRGRVRRRSTTSSSGRSDGDVASPSGVQKKKRRRRRSVLENRHRSASPSRSATPGGVDGQEGRERRRRRIRSRSHSREHVFEREKARGGDQRENERERVREREDEEMIRRQELERDGGEDRFEGVIAEDYDDGERDGERRRERDRDRDGDRGRDRDSERRHGRDERNQRDGWPERNSGDRNGATDGASGGVKFKGRGRMNYRERGDGAWGGGYKRY